MKIQISKRLRLLALLLVACLSYAAPIRIVVLQDKTESANWTRTPQITVADLDPIFDLLKQLSGELAFGLVRDSSNRGLVRVRIGAAPLEPRKPQRAGRSFDDMRSAREYREQHADWERKLVAWKTETEAKIVLFKAAVEPLIKQKADAPATDLWGAVRRADLLLAEPVAGHMTLHAWLLASTDGGHNRGPILNGELRSGARLVIVNAADESGSLASLHPLRFESLLAAIRFLVETESGGH
jgi:hypothetical protein